MTSSTQVAPTTRWGRPSSFDGLRLVTWLLTLAIVITPLAAVVWLGTSGNHVQLLFEDDVVGAARNSLVTAFLSAAAAVAIGTTLALLLDHTDLRGRNALRLFALSPMFVPPFVGAISWLGVFGPTQGINAWWSGLTGSPLWNLYGGDGVTFLLTIHSYPLTYLIVGAALRRIPSDLEQAARISGATPGRAIRDVTLPLLRPAMLAAFTLTFVSNLADFGIPAIIGLPERFTTLATLIYRYIQSGTVAKPLEVVSTIGLVLLVLAVLASILDARLNRGRTELEVAASTRATLQLGAARTPVTLAAWTLALAVTVMPIIALTIQALLPAPGVPLTPETITLDNFSEALGMKTTRIGITNSLVLAAGAAAIAGVLGLFVALIATRSRRSGPILTGIAMLPQAIPGTVLAVGWLIVAPRLGLFNSPWLILLAYVMAFLALVVQATVAPLRGIPAAWEESARVSGATRGRAALDIAARIALPAAATGGAMVFLTAVRELTISALLRGPGTQTLGVAIFDLQQAGNYNASSALSLLVTVVGLLGIGLVVRTPTTRKVRDGRRHP